MSDAEKLKQACQGYFDLTQEFLYKLHALAPEDVPEIKIPAPQFREFPNGGIHYYTLLAEAGFHKSVAPNAGLTKSTAILSLLPQQTRRLIEPSTLSLDGPLAQRDKPLAGAAHFNFAGLVDTLQAWANYVQEIEPSAQQFVGQATDVWPILKCWRGISSASYVEGDVLVTRTESRYIDL